MIHRSGRYVLPLLLVLVACSSLSCTTLRELSNLRNVRFSLDSVTDIHLAGVDVSSIRAYEDIRPLDIVQLTAAIARNEMPLAFNLRIEAENPAENSVQARLVRMDWTLLLEDRETISGVFDETVVLAPGTPTPVTFGIALDLIEFFGKNIEDLASIALSLAGEGGQPRNVKLRARPTIDTVLGPIRYPDEITIVSKDIG